MSTRRRYCRVAVLGNCIYALGGFDSSNYQSSVERFDPRIGHWLAMPPMTSRYIDHHLIVFISIKFPIITDARHVVLLLKNIFTVLADQMGLCV